MTVFSYEEISVISFLVGNEVALVRNPATMVEKSWLLFLNILWFWNFKMRRGKGRHWKVWNGNKWEITKNKRMGGVLPVRGPAITALGASEWRVALFSPFHIFLKIIESIFVLYGNVKSDFVKWWLLCCLITHFGEILICMLLKADTSIRIGWWLAQRPFSLIYSKSKDNWRITLVSCVQHSDSTITHIMKHHGKCSCLLLS